MTSEIICQGQIQILFKYNKWYKNFVNYKVFDLPAGNLQLAALIASALEELVKHVIASCALG